MSIVYICTAAEKTSGYGTICGTQFLGPLVRIYPAEVKARAILLAKGLTIKGGKVTLYAKNPFILVNGNGEEVPSTKLTVDGIPLSYSGEEIVDKLKNMGVNLLGPLVMERARNDEGKMTRWLTGRRWVWIETPKTPLPRNITCEPFTAKLYHKEMKQTQKTTKCGRCLKEGHVARHCEDEVACWGCGGKGHRNSECPRSLESRNGATYEVEEERSGGKIDNSVQETLMRREREDFERGKTDKDEAKTGEQSKQKAVEDDSIKEKTQEKSEDSESESDESEQEANEVIQEGKVVEDGPTAEEESDKCKGTKTSPPIKSGKKYEDSENEVSDQEAPVRDKGKVIHEKKVEDDGSIAEDGSKKSTGGKISPKKKQGKKKAKGIEPSPKC